GAGLGDVTSIEVDATYGVKEYVTAVGGVSKTLKLALRVLYRLMCDRRVHRYFRGVSKVKDVVMSNRKTKPYVGALLCAGRKPLRAA
ncbi:MAG: hypothetical protein ACYTEZ_19690, partial [Planctomycetota bacterium]